MSENMKNKIVLHNKNIKAYICLVHFKINVKTKMNCKTESYFLIMFSMVGRIRHSVRGLRTTGLQHNMYNLYFQCLFEQVAFRVLLELSKILLWSEFYGCNYSMRWWKVSSYVCVLFDVFRQHYISDVVVYCNSLGSLSLWEVVFR